MAKNNSSSVKKVFDTLVVDAKLILIVLLIPALVFFLIFFFWIGLAVFFFVGLALWILFSIYYARVLFSVSKVFRVVVIATLVAVTLAIVYSALPHLGL